jgi:hypothetical protein
VPGPHGAALVRLGAFGVTMLPPAARPTGDSGRVFGMPWTIPNLLFHDKPVPLSNMRSCGRNHVLLPGGREPVTLRDARDYVRLSRISRS